MKTKCKLEKIHDEADDDNESTTSRLSNNIERCPICLNSFKDQETGNPDKCQHTFCLECLEEWSKV